MAKPGRLRRWVLGIVGSIVLIAALLLLLLYMAPAIAIKVASKWYAQQGDGYSISVESWRFRPFETTLELHGLELKHPKRGNGLTKLATLTIDIDLRLLQQHIVHIRDLTLDGLNTQIYLKQTHGKGIFAIAGIRIPLGEETSTPTAEPVTANSDNSEAKSWIVKLDNIAISDQKLQWYVQVDELLTRGQIELMQVQLLDFSSDLVRPLDINAEFELQKFDLKGPQQIDLVKPMHIMANGQLSNLTSAPKWQGDINFDVLQLVMPGNVQAGFEQLSLRDLFADAKQQKVGEIILTGFKFGEPEKPLLQLDYYNVTDINISPNADQEKPFIIQIGQQAFSALALNIRRDKDGHLLGLPQAAEPETSEPDASASETIEQKTTEQKAAAAEAAPPVEPSTTKVVEVTEQVAVDVSPEGRATAVVEKTTEVELHKSMQVLLQILLAGLAQQNTDNGEAVNSVIRIEDRSISPAFKTDLTIRELTVGQIDSRINGSVVELADAIPIHLVAGLDRFNSIKVESKLGLFLRDGHYYPQGKIQLTIRQLDLVAFNGYLIAAMGYQLDRGSLDVDAEIIIDKAQLGGEIRLLLRNSRFTPVNEATIKRLQQQISMPVDTALELLRDRNGNVRLTIPLSGDLTDPNIGIQDIMKQVTQLAMRTSALFLLGQTLQPYAAVIGVAALAGDYLFAIRLDAMSFENNQTTLSDDHIKHLTKVAELMRDKKKIEVQACPFVNEAEVLEHGDDWPQIARARGNAIKNWITDFDEKISPRLSICRPQRGKKAEVILGVN